MLCAAFRHLGAAEESSEAVGGSLRAPEGGPGAENEVRVHKNSELSVSASLLPNLEISPQEFKGSYHSFLGSEDLLP